MVDSFVNDCPVRVADGLISKSDTYHPLHALSASIYGYDSSKRGIIAIIGRYTGLTQKDNEKVAKNQVRTVDRIR